MVQILTEEQEPEARLVHQDLDEYKAKRALAQCYTTQSRRLQHVANRLKIMMKMDRCQPHSSRASRKAAFQHKSSGNQQSWKNLDDLNKRTMAVALRGVAKEDPEAVQRVKDAEERVRPKELMAGMKSRPPPSTVKLRS